MPPYWASQMDRHRPPPGRIFFVKSICSPHHSAAAHFPAGGKPRSLRAHGAHNQLRRERGPSNRLDTIQSAGGWKNARRDGTGNRSTRCHNGRVSVRAFLRVFLARFFVRFWRVFWRMILFSKLLAEIISVLSDTLSAGCSTAHRHAKVLHFLAPAGERDFQQKFVAATEVRKSVIESDEGR